MRQRVVEVFLIICAVVLQTSDAQLAKRNVNILARTTGGLRASTGFRNCTETEFRCQTGICIPLQWKCDNEKDCSDNSDEDPNTCNSKTCSESQFRCNSGKCIPLPWKCDSENDCFDGSDEDSSACNGVPPKLPKPARPDSPILRQAPPTTLPCTQSTTTVNGGLPTCAGQLIFIDNFYNQLDPERWSVEQRLPADDQDNEFVSYQKNTVRSSRSWLTITPLVLQSVGYSREDIISGVLDLSAGCTARSEELCKMQANYMNILPPVVTGKISSRGLFSFKYGKVEIRAKLPQGDWLNPVLYLEPQTSQYGSAGYSSGIIRVAFSRGNQNLHDNGQNIGNVHLSGGVVLDDKEPCRGMGMVSKNADKPWGGKLHTYGIVWTNDSIEFSVDGVTYGTVKPPEGGFKAQCSNFAGRSWPQESKIAPFDQEFYISLGVGVGGTSDFPDGVGGKPWNNTSPKARSSFFKAINSWRDTWMDDSKSLRVDKVRVWAL